MPLGLGGSSNVPSALLARAEIQSLSLTKWDGGWRPDKAPSELEPNELQKSLNAELTEGAGFRKRGGRVAMTDAVTDLDKIEFFFTPRVYTDDGLQPEFSQIAFAFNESDGSLYYANFGQLEEDFLDDAEGADFVDTGQSPGNAGGGSSNYFRIWPLQVVTFEDKIYVTSLRYAGFSGGSGSGGTWETEDGTSSNGSKPIIYDAQNDSFSRPGVADLDSGDEGNGNFPRARCMLGKYDRIFVANVHMTGEWRYPSRIYWSDAGTATDWNVNSWLTVGIDDGTEITALQEFGEQIIVFKNDSVWTLSGTDEDTFALYSLDDEKGCEGTFAVTASPREIFFFDEQTASVYAYDGGDFDEIGAPVQKYIKQRLNKNASAKVVLQVVGEQLWLSFPDNSFTDVQTDKNAETLVYDLRHRVWTSTWDFGLVPKINFRESDYQAVGPDGVIEGGDTPYFAATGVAVDNVITKGFQGLNDEGSGVTFTDYGSNFDMDVWTFWLNPGGARNRIRRAEVLLGASSESTAVEIALGRDLYTDDWQSYDIDFTDHVDDVEEFHHQTAQVDTGRWTWLQFRVSSSDSTIARVNSIRMQIQSRRLPRGATTGTQYHDSEAACV